MENVVGRWKNYCSITLGNRFFFKKDTVEDTVCFVLLLTPSNYIIKAYILYNMKTYEINSRNIFFMHCNL